jgi:hypothetical protein
MRRLNWRLFALVLALSAMWWFFTLAPGCGRPRPLELSRPSTAAAGTGRR